MREDGQLGWQIRVVNPHATFLTQLASELAQHRRQCTQAALAHQVVELIHGRRDASFQACDLGGNTHIVVRGVPLGSGTYCTSVALKPLSDLY